ncbi:MAG: hypothetical protein C4533_01570 [Candidatus Omnitrophota bacterium]|jgi:hypothetical protein|nr:MAG: hypothetical protein C4533_01570 [Candidatus Omnitrophota bacterium]
MDNKKIYNNDLIVFSILGSLCLLPSLLMLYYFFVSESSQPPYLLRMLFEIMLSSKTYAPMWSEVDKDLLLYRAIIWMALGIGLIGFGIYKYKKESVIKTSL